ncbi:MAG TPA: sigma factor-like helix-turn-helix DNA-binding protein [Thermodesulfobacteriota bacterium]|nr:sigma factor-like helix-turn-helix DNA-binding protein [Thermodesulfobacteriota bacterium]
MELNSKRTGLLIKIGGIEIFIPQSEQTLSEQGNLFPNEYFTGEIAQFERTRDKQTVKVKITDARKSHRLGWNCLNLLLRNDPILLDNQRRYILGISRKRKGGLYLDNNAIQHSKHNDLAEEILTKKLGDMLKGYKSKTPKKLVIEFQNVPSQVWDSYKYLTKRKPKREFQIEILQDSYVSELPDLSGLENAISRLSPEQREVVNLTLDKGLNKAEIARYLKISKPAVSKRLTLAVTNLKRILSE